MSFKTNNKRTTLLAITGVLLATCLMVALAYADDTATVSDGVASQVNQATPVLQEAINSIHNRHVRLKRLDRGESPGVAYLGDYVDEDTGDVYLVDERSEQVRAWGSIAASNRSAVDTKGLDRQTDMALAQAAKEIAADHFPRWANETQSFEVYTEGIRADGSAHQTMHYEFREYAGEIPTCNHLTLTLNVETGELVGFSQDDGTVDVDSVAKISHEEALGALSTAARMPIYTTEDVEEMIWRDPETNTPHLVIRASLYTGDAMYGGSCSGFVDLHTGEVLMLGAS